MRLLILLACAGALFGQGTEPKPKPEDYEVHGQTRGMAIGAEFMVHSYSRGEQTYLAENYLVVEVALYPPKDTKFEVQEGNFTLRLNGKKLLEAAAPSMVAASLKHPEWEQQTGLRPTISGQAGNAGVIYGAPPRNTSPFPGSNPPGTTMPPRVDIPKDNPSGIEKVPVKADELLLETALLEGEHHSPTSGFLYFSYRGKIKDIKTLELLYGDAVLKLR